MKLSYALILVVLSASPALAMDEVPARLRLNSCAISLQGSGESELKKRIKAGDKSPEADAYQRLIALSKEHPELKKVLPQAEVAELLADSEQMIFHQTIGDFLKLLKSSRSTTLSESVLESAQAKALHLRVTEASMPARFKALQSASEAIDLAGRLSRLRYAFGELELNELQLLVHGGDPLAPTPDSLVGLYLAETKASSVVRKFKTSPRGWSKGPKRLVVALSDETFDTYLKYFKRPEFLVHLHTPGQGTLMLSHNGRAGTYSRMERELRLPTQGSILPHLILKTSEAQRANQFFELAMIGYQYTREPWLLPEYCATGGYESCTHWVGNIPLGDELVDKYSFPGRVDEHAYNSVGKGPQTKKLAPYEITSSHDHYMAGYYTGQPPTRFEIERYKNLVRRVWKAPGHMQLSQLLGPKEFEAALGGEYANPGYVAIRLTGNVSPDRMPVIFYVVPDHRAKVASDFDPQISAY